MGRVHAALFLVTACFSSAFSQGLPEKLTALQSQLDSPKVADRKAAASELGDLWHSTYFLGQGTLPEKMDAFRPVLKVASAHLLDKDENVRHEVDKSLLQIADGSPGQIWTGLDTEFSNALRQGDLDTRRDLTDLLAISLKAWPSLMPQLAGFAQSEDAKLALYSRVCLRLCGVADPDRTYRFLLDGFNSKDANARERTAKTNNDLVLLMWGQFAPDEVSDFLNQHIRFYQYPGAAGQVNFNVPESYRTKVLSAVKLHLSDSDAAVRDLCAKAALKVAQYQDRWLSFGGDSKAEADEPEVLKVVDIAIAQSKDADPKLAHDFSEVRKKLVGLRIVT